MPKPPPPELGTNLFTEKQPATANLMNKGGAAPPPPPLRPPATAQASAAPEPVPVPDRPEPKQPQPPTPLRVVPDTPTESTASPEGSVEPEPAPEAPTAPEPVMPVGERDKMIDAVFAVIDSEPELAADAVLRLASATNRDPAALDALLKRIETSPPRAGKQPEPLDVAPQLHRKAKAEVARLRSHGERATLTTVALTAIGQAHEDGRLAKLVARFHGHERHRIPVFGNVVVGAAPRGATVKYQFAPDPRSRLMVDVFTWWHRIPRANLVRLVLEDRYRRKPKAETEEPQKNSAAEPTTSESNG